MTLRTHTQTRTPFCCLIIIALAFAGCHDHKAEGDAAKRNVCHMFLKQIADSKAKWALANHKGTNDTPTWVDLVGTNYLLTEEPRCLKGGTYTIGRIEESPRCTIPEHTLERR